MSATKPHSRPRRKKVVLHLDRNDVALLIDAMEELIESVQENFGTADERRVLDFLNDRLHRHDGSHQYRRVTSGV